MAVQTRPVALRSSAEGLVAGMVIDIHGPKVDIKVLEEGGEVPITEHSVDRLWENKVSWVGCVCDLIGIS